MLQQRAASQSPVALRTCTKEQRGEDRFKRRNLDVVAFVTGDFATAETHFARRSAWAFHPYFIYHHFFFFGLWCPRSARGAGEAAELKTIIGGFVGQRWSEENRVAFTYGNRSDRRIVPCVNRANRDPVGGRQTWGLVEKVEAVVGGWCCRQNRFIPAIRIALRGFCGRQMEKWRDGQTRR